MLSKISHSASYSTSQNTKLIIFHFKVSFLIKIHLINFVIQTYKEIRVSATMIEQYLDEKGIHIGHNRIHKILLEAKLAKEEHRKKNRRKWVRYERKHSNSLWHTDWFEYKGKKCIIFIDDASRFIPCYGEFSNANTENSLRVFRK